MSWIKIDAGFFRHPKAIRAGRDGRILFIASVCYAGDGLTDGFVPEGALALLAAETGITKPKEAANQLVDSGLWEVVEGGFQVHDYLEYNTASGKVQAERDAAKERMKRRRSENVRPNNPRSSENVRIPETEVEIELPPKPPKGGSRETRISEDFAIDDDMTQWAMSKGFTQPEIDHHTEAFTTYWRGEGGPKARKLNWRQAWQTWLLREKPGRWPGGGSPQPIRPGGKPPLPPVMERGNVPADGGLSEWLNGG